MLIVQFGISHAKTTGEPFPWTLNNGENRFVQALFTQFFKLTFPPLIKFLASYLRALWSSIIWSNYKVVEDGTNGEFLALDIRRKDKECSKSSVVECGSKGSTYSFQCTFCVFKCIWCVLLHVQFYIIHSRMQVELFRKNHGQRLNEKRKGKLQHCLPASPTDAVI